MTTPAATLPHATAIVGALTAASLAAYLGEADRAGDGTVRVPPYVVVHVAGGAVHSEDGSDRGVLGDPTRDIDVAFQTTSVGVTAAQALNVHDRTVVALTAATPAVSGRTPLPIVPDGPPDRVRRDDTAAEPLFYAVARWTWRTTT